jgi:hypothetical protein
MHRTLNLNILCLLFIALAIITRIAIYIHNPNFWIDEAMLAQSIFVANLKEVLLGNLPANQAAPLGFILSVKALSFYFGYSEYVLRIIPLLAGILIFPVAYSFAVREFNKKFACIFLFFLTISTPLLFYNIQFKQYATEILVSLLYLNSFCKNRKAIIEECKIPISVTLLAPIGMLFSSASIFVLAGLFAMVIFEHWKVKQIKHFLRNNWMKILIIAAFLLCYYLLWLSQIKGIKNGFMDAYWKYNYLGAVNPISLLKAMTAYFIVISNNLYFNCILFASLFFSGLVFLFREKRQMFFAIITGIAFYLIAYLLGKYPLVTGNINLQWPLKAIGSRIFAHFIPIVLIVPSYIVFKLLELKKIKKLAFLILISMLCFTCYFSYQKIASGLEIARISELIETIEDENSAVVITSLAVPPYFYYQSLRGKNSGEIYMLHDPEPTDVSEYFNFPGYSVIFIKPGLPFETFFEDIKNNGKKKAYFIFYPVGGASAFHFNQLYSYASNNLPLEKVSLYEGQGGIRAILVELE